MARYVIKRILALIPTLLIIVFIVFFIMNLLPSSPGVLILGQQATPEAIEEFNDSVGYNDPFLVRYFNYIIDACHGDLGKSWRTGRAVTEVLASRIPVTFTLAVGSILIGAIVGVGLGVLSAVKQYSVWDFSGTVFALTLASFPPFWLGMILILVFSLMLGLLPAFGVGSLKHFILPWLSLSGWLIAAQLRMTRTSMLETIRMDYVRTARSKGLKENVVIFRHALKNALLPIITLIGMNLGTMLGGTVTVETVFSLPGVGSMIVDSIRMKDIPQVLGATVMLATWYTLVMVVVDILYAFIDPKIKARYMKH